MEVTCLFGVFVGGFDDAMLGRSRCNGRLCMRGHLYIYT